ncbi:cytochrome P450 2B11-like isoform X2 [Ascaphus truei]|uniref:cytochrome P450 2B11-like isoform X2 n=1 Tax=Ascaphus truei TaxID=8439 RepID=UPI003F5A1FD0
MDWSQELTSFSLIILIASLLLLLARKMFASQGRLPPGPKPVPLLGNLLQLRSRDIHKRLLELSEKFGPVYTLYLGPQPVVVLCGYKAVKEALVDHGEKFSGRAELPIVDLTSQGYGIAFSNGERWKELRRFSITTLRNFGMGKRNIEERIQEEVQFLMEAFQETQGVALTQTYHVYRFWFCKIRLYNFFPTLLSILPGPHHKLTENYQEQVRYVEEIVQEHKKSLDPAAPRDYIDAFLIKIQQDNQNPHTEFHKKNLCSSALDIFFAGQETTSSTLGYGLLILMKYPHIKEKIQAEIESVIGLTRSPCMEDRAKMPYTDAVIHEIQRFIDILPLGAPHSVTGDTLFRGYSLPKGTVIFPLLHSVLFDSTLFERPQEFDPSHFLNQSGSFKKNEGFMPFSAGKRICLGEGLARMELFLYFTSILQRFDIKPSTSPSDIDLSPEYSGFGKKPPSFQLALVPY